MPTSSLNVSSRTDGLHQTLDQVLAAAVTQITGSTEARPRPGQVALSHDILTAMIGDADGTPGHVAGVAPTGVGKSLGGLAPAMLMAAVRDERTIMSTHSLALMGQVAHKDAPMVAAAVEQVTGKPVTFAVLKGFGNIACPLAVHGTAVDLLGDEKGQWDLTKLPVGSSRPDAARQSLRDLKAALTAPRTVRRSRKKPHSPMVVSKLPDEAYNQAQTVPLLAWAIDQVIIGTGGDRADYTGDLNEQAWSTMSVAPGDCLNTSCPLLDVCLPRKARTRAAEADLVITNHSMLGVQAAMQVPVLLGSHTIGNFDHLIVDEAHELPGVVRNSGSREISARRVTAVVKAFDRTMTGSDPQVAATSRTGTRLAEMVDEDLHEAVSHAHATAGRGVRYGPDNHPMRHTAETLSAWCEQASRLCPSPASQSSPKAGLALKRLKSRLRSLLDDVTVALGEDPETVRWVEKSDDGNVSLKMSPVDVSGLIAGNLFKAEWVDADTEEAADPDGETVKEPLSVTMMSATLPTSFRADSGIRAQTREYESPFDRAYGASMVHCPRLTDPADVARVAVAGDRGRWKFDTTRHMDWAGDRIVDLVTANCGSALILSANKAAGLEYTQRLRARLDPSIRVFSQWDGRDARHITDEWRHDPASVMVGTRSMMTGIDAPGDTCTLVVVDRVPRAAGNVVDDARVELLTKTLQISKWDAERYVYGADAALLLEQAAGRLIRAVTDNGLMVCLDPRIVPNSPLSYPKQTSDLYLRAFRRFTNRQASPQLVAEFLRQRTEVAA